MFLDMDELLIIQITMDFYTGLEQWKVSRLLNRTFKSIVDTKKYDNECTGRRCFLRSEWCCVCQKNNPDCVWLGYKVDELYQVNDLVCRWLTHCPSWYCRVSALYSMIEDYKSSNILLLRKPWQVSTTVTIPRSDGSESVGKAQVNCVFQKQSIFYVHVEWYENKEKFFKQVPLTYYTDESPKVLFA